MKLLLPFTHYLQHILQFSRCNHACMRPVPLAVAHALPESIVFATYECLTNKEILCMLKTSKSATLQYVLARINIIGAWDASWPITCWCAAVSAHITLPTAWRVHSSQATVIFRRWGIFKKARTCACCGKHNATVTVYNKMGPCAQVCWHCKVTRFDFCTSLWKFPRAYSLWDRNMLPYVLCGRDHMYFIGNQ